MTTPPTTSPAWKRWLPAALWAVVIFAGSSLPGSVIPGGYSVYGHLSEYAMLGALAAWAERRRGPLVAAVIGVGFVALYGASDEIHQLFVPLRMADPLDWLTDIAGACAGIGVLSLVGWLRARWLRGPAR